LKPTRKKVAIDQKTLVSQAIFMLQLDRDPQGQLIFTDGFGQRQVGVEPIRAFPLSNPREGIALCDRKGKELFWVDSLDDLPAEIRDLLEVELARREFVPVIQRIVGISTATEPSEWEVATDRGVTRFILNSEEDIHRLLDGKRALIKDAQGLRYLITNLSGLDPTSRRLLERYI
jgi:hypothetical protein